MEKVDTRILDLLKEKASKSYVKADKTAFEVLNKVYEDAPANKLENMIYWFLMNYYTYEIVMTICNEIEKHMETEK